MHTDAALVRRLLLEQFPQWAELPIEPLLSSGTDHTLYRIGDAIVARFPRAERASLQVAKEHEWLPRLAPHLPLPIPVPLAKGSPGGDYPWSWSIVPWLDGEEATSERLVDPCRAATDLATFIAALQRVDPAGGPSPGEHNFSRGVPLAQRDRRTREGIAALNGMLDTGAATEVWDAALDALVNDSPAWIHGDISSGNLLVAEGRLSAVIDFGGLAAGDPACDLMIAWTLFSGESRKAFRAALAVDDATWMRGRGWALSWALIFIPYYLHTNPVGVAHAWRAIDEILADHRANG